MPCTCCATSPSLKPHSLLSSPCPWADLLLVHDLLICTREQKRNCAEWEFKCMFWNSYCFRTTTFSVTFWTVCLPYWNLSRHWWMPSGSSARILLIGKKRSGFLRDVLGCWSPGFSTHQHPPLQHTVGGWPVKQWWGSIAIINWPISPGCAARVFCQLSDKFPLFCFSHLNEWMGGWS